MLLSATASLAVGACAAPLPLPTPAHAAAAQDSWPGTTAADLERGRETYARRCNACHFLHAPAEVAPDRWPDWVKKMAPRAKLSGAEAEDILRYLVVLSQAR